MIERRSKKDTTGIIRPDPQTSISKDHQFPSLSESLPHPRPLVNSFISEKLNDLLKLISSRRWWWWQRYVWQMVQYQYPRGLRAFFRYRCEPLIIPDIKSQIISRMMRSLLRYNRNWLNQIIRINTGANWDGKVSPKKWKEDKFHLLKIPIDIDFFLFNFDRSNCTMDDCWDHTWELEEIRNIVGQLCTSGRTTNNLPMTTC